MLRRREFMGAGVCAAATLAFGGAFWKGRSPTRVRQAGAARPRGVGMASLALQTHTGSGRLRIWCQPGTGRGGRRGHRLLLAPGPTARPRSQAMTAARSSSRTRRLRGGAGAIRFGPGGEIRDAYRILEGTTNNCAAARRRGARRLSCEEHGEGRVWECDPTGRREARVHDAQGVQARGGGGRPARQAGVPRRT